MTRSFDFSSFHSPPSHLKVLEASKERLRLLEVRKGRTWIITGRTGTFMLEYVNEVQEVPCFVMASDSLYQILCAIGAVRSWHTVMRHVKTQGFGNGPGKSGSKNEPETGELF